MCLIKLWNCEIQSGLHILLTTTQKQCTRSNQWASQCGCPCCGPLWIQCGSKDSSGLHAVTQPVKDTLKSAIWTHKLEFCFSQWNTKAVHCRFVEVRAKCHCTKPAHWSTVAVMAMSQNGMLFVVWMRSFSGANFCVNESDEMLLLLGPNNTTAYHSAEMH